MPAAAGVVGEKGSEYILTHTGPRELDGNPLGGVWVGVWFSFRLYYSFGKGPGQNIIWHHKNKKCENENNLHWAEGVGQAPPGGVWVGVWFSTR